MAAPCHGCCGGCFISTGTEDADGFPGDAADAAAAFTIKPRRSVEGEMLVKVLPSNFLLVKWENFCHLFSLLNWNFGFREVKRDWQWALRGGFGRRRRFREEVRARDAMDIGGGVGLFWEI
mgnify:CR=1 FL=1